VVFLCKNKNQISDNKRYKNDRKKRQKLKNLDQITQRSSAPLEGNSFTLRLLAKTRKNNEK
jgi:hypothetical protein